MTDLIKRYLEDFEAGQTFRSGRIRIDGERIKSFAAEFDPQPFHLDERAASDSIFGGLAASGWHTAAITMRLLVESELAPVGGIVGAGFDEFRWPRPVRPGDELRVESEVLEYEPRSSSRTRAVKVRITTLNWTINPCGCPWSNLIVPRRRARVVERHSSSIAMEAQIACGPAKFQTRKCGRMTS
jgi:acyl dehydratase